MVFNHIGSLIIIGITIYQILGNRYVNIIENNVIGMIYIEMFREIEKLFTYYFNVFDAI